MSQEGLEPPTYRFEVCHSIQLSYWPAAAYRAIRRVQYSRISDNCQEYAEPYRKQREYFSFEMIRGKMLPIRRAGETLPLC